MLAREDAATVRQPVFADVTRMATHGRLGHFVRPDDGFVEVVSRRRGRRLRAGVRM